jgi:outer membrane protein assembly factor BamB
MIKTTVCILILSCLGFSAEEKPFWEQFLGPDRRGISQEKDLIKKIPANGLIPENKFQGAGSGYSSLSFGKSLIFTAGDDKDNEYVIAFDMSGKQVWKSNNGGAWNGEYPGSRSTPLYNSGSVYHMNALGNLAAFEAKTGKTIWEKDLNKIYGVNAGNWGLAESVSIDGNNIIAFPCGKDGYVIALDKNTGKEVWVNMDLDDIAGYCSAIVVNHKKNRMIISMTGKNIVGINAANGSTLFKAGHATAFDVNASSPIYKDGFLFISSGYGTGAKYFKISDDGKTLIRLWTNNKLDNKHHGVLLINGSIYGSGDESDAFFCINPANGKVLWKSIKIRKSMLVSADGMIWCLSEEGNMTLLEANPKAENIAGSFNIPKETDSVFWAYPAIFDGRLWIRHDDNIYVYNIKQ